jgi:UDP-N-acetyl-D-glucosamine/UDP-N-acetyl-D-galactosamine dehydrogenase
VFEAANVKICIVGLGYVGLPLAALFSKNGYHVIGFDIDDTRIKQLKDGIDTTKEFTKKELRKLYSLNYTSDFNGTEGCNVYIITVPTPVDLHNRPNLLALEKASEMVGSVINQKNVIIFESTVYPGCTEEICVPKLESLSGLKVNTDFFVGYSPERINPGDKTHQLQNITKVTSGSNAECADFVDKLYSSIITAGTHKAPSIRVAEAAKVIENTQRDVNIALVNELSIIFDILGLDTSDILEAAGTKWNFLPFKPGLVGGHCIGVDPYYLTYKAQEVGYEPEIILAGRRINDAMGDYVAHRLIKSMIKVKIDIQTAKILILGITFKENCPDTRNTKVLDVVNTLNEFNLFVDVYDPIFCCDSIHKSNDLNIVTKLKNNFYDAIILAVPHDEFKKMGASKIRSLGKKNHIFLDLKSIFAKNESDIRI